MASGQILSKLRNLYAKAGAEVKAWNEQQEQGLSLLRTISNVIARLPALQSPGNYGALVDIPDIQQKLVQKQMLGLEQVFADLHKTLAELEAACCALERHATNGQRLVQQDKSLTAAARATSAGPIPSIDQCLQGLRDIWQMHAAELQLKRAIVGEIQYDTSEADLQQAVALYAAQPNIDGPRVRDLLYVVAATGEAQQSL